MLASVLTENNRQNAPDDIKMYGIERNALEFVFKNQLKNLSLWRDFTDRFLLDILFLTILIFIFDYQFVLFDSNIKTTDNRVLAKKITVCKRNMWFILLF